MLVRLLLTLLMSLTAAELFGEDGPIFRAAASSATVTPPIGTYIAGDAQNRTFKSIHDDLFVKTVVMSYGNSAVAIVTVDCIGLTSHTIRTMQAEAARRAGLDELTAERIIIASTHCHSGPDVVGLWGPDYTQSGVDADYMEQLITRTAEQVAKAAKSLVPASIRAASRQSRIQWIENISEPGEFDRELTVIRIDDANGRCLATMTAFACHPTILDGVHDVVSSDWPGGLYRGMQEQLSGEHLFIQGAVGGWIQPKKGDRSFELADRYGRELAAEALETLHEAKPEADPHIRFASQKITLPLVNKNWVGLIKSGLLPINSTDEVETTVAAFSVGGIGFATHPGETSPVHSHQTRAWLNTEHTMIIGLGLDALGYIVKPDYFDHPDLYQHANYLTSMSLGPRTAPLMMQGLKKVTHRISHGTRSD